MPALPRVLWSTRARRTGSIEFAAWIGVLALSAVVAAGGVATATVDTDYFLRSSTVLLSSRWASTFADPGLQCGPLQLTGIGVAARVGHAVGLAPLRAVSIAQNLLLTGLVLVGARTVCGRHSRSVALAGVGIAALATGTIGGSYFYGHPAEVINPVLWILAARAARQAKPLRASVLIGTSAGFETWGILGVAVLALCRSRRALALGAAGSAAVAAGIYAPFVLHGSFDMFGYRWLVAPGTVPSLLGIGPAFGWPWRLVQGALAAAAGAAAAVGLRRRDVAVWASPLAVLCAKVGLDPAHGAWYLLAPQTVVLLGAAQIATSRLRAAVSASPTCGAAAGEVAPLGVRACAKDRPLPCR